MAKARQADDGQAPDAPPDADTLAEGLSKPLRDVLDSLPDGVIVADVAGRFLHFSSAAERMLGLGALTIPSSDWSAAYGCYHEDGVTPIPSAQLPLARSIKGETVRDFVLFVRSPAVPHGRWLSVSSRPLRGEGDRVVGGVAVLREVRGERLEMTRTELLSTVVQQTADTVFITDREGLIEYVNPALERTTGFSATELIGKTPRVFRSGAHTDAFYSDMWATLLTGNVFRGTLINRKRSGEEYHSEQTITPIRDHQGTVVHFVSVGKDVTERRKAAEQESRHLLARAVQQRFFPAVPPPVCGFEFGSAVYTMDKTGGDYFDYLSLPDGAIGVVVGDVSGHAFDAALVMAVTRAYVRSIAHTDADPGSILTRVNEVLSEDVPDNQFATLVLASLHAPSNTLKYASAGHTTGYVLDRHGGIKSELPSTGIPLGIVRETTYETAAAVTLQVGDLVVFFTDGITEAQDSDGALFGASRALDVVRRHQREPAAKIVHRVYRAVREYSRPRSQDDDITAVVCRVGPRHEQPS